MDFANFNGLWVVCETSYVTDPDKFSFSRSMMYVTTAYRFGRHAGEYSEWHVPFFTTKDESDKVCAQLGLNPDSFRSVQIYSLRQLDDVLSEQINLGRRHMSVDDSELVRVDDFLAKLRDYLGRNK